MWNMKAVSSTEGWNVEGQSLGREVASAETGA